MEKAKIISIKYVPSESLEKQGKSRDIEKYRKQGYYVKEARNGYYLLLKSARVEVTLAIDTLTKTFDMKEDLLALYAKERITQTTVNKFINALETGKMIIYMNHEGNYEILI